MSINLSKNHQISRVYRFGFKNDTRKTGGGGLRAPLPPPPGMDRVNNSHLLIFYMDTWSFNNTIFRPLGLKSQRTNIYFSKKYQGNVNELHK